RRGVFVMQLVRKALLIGHYFPPGTSSGTLRTVKFAKYLPESNWEPLILTMNPDIYAPLRQDRSLLAELSPELKVYRTNAWMLDRYLAKWKRGVRRLASRGGKTEERGIRGSVAPRSSRQARLSYHIRNWLQFPDDYGGWFMPALWRGSRIIASESIDMIYSTAPSPVAHMIAMGLKKWTGKPWVADFR